MPAACMGKKAQSKHILAVDLMHITYETNRMRQQHAV